MQEYENRYFTLFEAADILGIPNIYGKSHITIECPCCFHSHNNKRKTMDLNFNKNVYNCPRCGASGSALSFWAMMRGITDYKSAAKDYYTYIGKFKEKNNTFETRKYEQKVENEKLASLETRDKTYRNFLSKLILYPTHKENLLSRGLDDAAIEKGLYKSFPKGCIKKIIESMLNDGMVLDNVPGFYKDKSWQIQGAGYYSGYFVPIINGDGLIQSMQLRTDKGDTRYFYFSSADKNRGAKAVSAVHLAKGERKKLILTEGPLKANVISYFTNCYCLAIPGVKTINHLDEALRAIKYHGFNEIYIAFDMDYKENKNVKKALEDLKAILKHHKLAFKTLNWNEKYKGFDDYLYNQIFQTK